MRHHLIDPHAEHSKCMLLCALVHAQGGQFGREPVLQIPISFTGLT